MSNTKYKKKVKETFLVMLAALGESCGCLSLATVFYKVMMIITYMWIKKNLTTF